MALKMEDLEPEVSSFDDFEGTITGAWFSPCSAEYMKQANLTEAVPFLNLEVTSPDFERPVNIGFSVGARFSISDDKQSLFIKDKPEARFNSKSNAWIFAQELFRIAGDGVIKEGQKKFLERRYRMIETGFYLGLSSRWVRRPFTHPLDSEKTVKVQVATDYLTFSEVKTVGRADVGEIGEGNLDILLTLATGKDTEQLRTAIVKDANLKADKVLMNLVYNKGLLEKLETEGKLVRGDDGKYL